MNMARKRMFSLSVVDCDKFLDLPLTSQLLYFHLGMRADDDGFVDSPRKIQRAIGCSDDDLKLLILKRFVIAFESGVIVIRHWCVHNTIQKDRYHETIYKAEKGGLTLNDTGAYESECDTNVYGMETHCIQNGSPGIGLSLVQDKDATHLSAEADKSARQSINYQQIVDIFNRVCVSLPKVQAITDRRKKAIRAATQTIENFGGWEKLFEAVEQSDFLTGRSGAWTGCAFDWIIKPANITKIIEGNFKNGRKAKTSQAHDFSDPANYKEQDIDYEKIFRN